MAVTPYVSGSELAAIVVPQGATITGTSSPLTIDEVATICARVTLELDGAAAAAGYTVPVPTTAEQAYGQMQAAAIDGAGWKLLRRIFPNMGGPGDKSTSATEMRQAYDDFKKTLREGKTVLIGHGSSSSGGGRELPRYSGNPSPALSMDSQF